MEQGTALAYSIDRLQDRGIFFIEPGEEIYKSQIVGEHTRGNDLEVNLTKGKKLTNIAPAKVLRLEEALEYVQTGEFVEVTPKSIRLRKR
jgi:GTP-binding protein